MKKIFAKLSELHNLDKLKDAAKYLPKSGFAICGGVAVSYYTNGVREPSPDLDLVVLPTTYRKMQNNLSTLGDESTNNLGFSLRGPGVDIDVIKAQYAFVQEGIKKATKTEIAPVLPIEHLCLMKFETGRAKDLVDAKMLIKQHPKIADDVLALNAKHGVLDEHELHTLLFLAHHD